MAVRQIAAADAGTWLDGSKGWTNGYRAVKLAMEWGWTIPEEYAEDWAAFEKVYGDSDAWEKVKGDDDALVDKATEHLQSLAPDGYIFRWDDGLALLPVWADCAADGDGCTIDGYRSDGSDIVTPCPDHEPDRLIRVVPKVLADDRTVYAVMLWDKSGEVMSGHADVTFTESAGYPTGEYWFPDLIKNPRIREAAEALLGQLK